jgi:hypothetical protein
MSIESIHIRAFRMRSHGAGKTPRSRVEQNRGGSAQLPWVMLWYRLEMSANLERLMMRSQPRPAMWQTCTDGSTISLVMQLFNPTRQSDSARNALRLHTK